MKEGRWRGIKNLTRLSAGSTFYWIAFFSWLVDSGLFNWMSLLWCYCAIIIKTVFVRGEG